MIKLQIIGNLGNDCIVKEVNGKNVINFNVANTERFKDAQGNLKEKTTWVNCAYWTDRTGIAPYLTKGQTVYAEGIPEVESYTNKDNQPAATLRMRVQNVQLLGGKSGDNQGAQGMPNTQYNSGGNTSASMASNKPVAHTASPVDDLPF